MFPNWRIVNVQALNNGAITQSYTLAISDGKGSTVNQTVTITLNGVDEPVTVITLPTVYTGADPNDSETSGMTGRDVDTISGTAGQT